ncbi:MAG TPA: T9SS type B sorting domain-containing protein, partial [Crocinitomicaceae bacterium]|nr:T9SS type B sorting domain-containing protein [Crocinitomicaceae bacterium]
NNDFWEILYLDEVYPENQVFVYNRWGNLVYSSDKGDYNGRPWRGDFEGKNVAVGSYFYVIELGVSATLDNLVSSDKNFLQEEADKLKGSVSVVWM